MEKKYFWKFLAKKFWSKFWKKFRDQNFQFFFLQFWNLHLMIWQNLQKGNYFSSPLSETTVDCSLVWSARLYGQFSLDKTLTLQAGSTVFQAKCKYSLRLVSPFKRLSGATYQWQQSHFVPSLSEPLQGNASAILGAFVIVKVSTTHTCKQP